MPPAEFGKPLSTEEIAALRQWIEQGARYATHWSYVKPVRTVPPAAPEAWQHWPRNAIDRFALQAMLAHGLHPSPEADRYALARRVFLDLTGLPPTVEEVDAFVKNEDPQAYEKLVDDLLHRPSYGEHWARMWLDLARYADSAGYADDPPRTIWAYRDWVIKAIQRKQAVRSVHDRADCRRLVAQPQRRATDRHGLSSQYADQQRRRHTRRGVSQCRPSSIG